MRSWRLHWDHQLYKALEHQYQLGLQNLNQHLAEIPIELIYRFVGAYKCAVERMYLMGSFLGK